MSNKSTWQNVRLGVRGLLKGNNIDVDAIPEVVRSTARMYGLSDDPKKVQEISQQFQKSAQSQANKKSDRKAIILARKDSAWKEWMNFLHVDTPRSDTYYWYLSQTKNMRYTSLQHITNAVMRLLSDPRRNEPPVSRKGLILGDVQAGKTRTYISLINLAADFGYKLFIVLTSDNENLRRQTQRRIDTDFVGFRAGKRIGVGTLTGQGVAIPLTVTNEDKDFIKYYEQAYTNLSRPSWNSAPYIAVVKKNASILSKFIHWLRPNRQERIDLPTLIIDDESDYASVNTASASDTPTKINSLVRTLFLLSRRTSYVAVTATPFANIFVDDREETDLFPQDFIYILPPSQGYIGVKQLFGDMDSLPADTGTVKQLDGNELDNWLPLIHRKNSLLSGHGLDCQLENAINCFIVACALRSEQSIGRQSMLIHMSRFIHVQEQIASRVFDYLGDVDRTYRFHADHNPFDVKMERVFDREYAKISATNWSEFAPKLRHFILSGRLRVRLINSGAGNWNLEHSLNDDNVLGPDECTIFVGGDQLSRGMTLEGLLCSVFYRQVTSSDTLLQMGRWFGYHTGYSKLERIWVLPQTILDYRYSCTLVEELKETAQRMHELGMSPKQYGIALKKNPNRGVRITSFNKMRSASKTDDLQDFDMAGQLLESTRLDASEKRLASNFDMLSGLIKECSPSLLASTSRSHSSAMTVFQDVPNNVVEKFLTGYKSGYADRFFGPTLLTYWDDERELPTTMAEEYVKTQGEEDSPTWNIAFVNGSGPEVTEVPFHWRQVKRTCILRNGRQHEKQFQISGSHMRLADPDNVKQLIRTLNPSQSLPSRNVNERSLYLTRYFGNHPSLLLYDVKIVDPNVDEDLIPARGILAAKMIVPQEKFGSHSRLGKATYYLNTVAARNQMRLLRQQAFEDSDN